MRPDSGDQPVESGFSLFDDLELHMQFAPVCRLSDGAIAAVELTLRGPAGTRLGTARALRRAARLMEQHRLLDARKLDFAATPGAQRVAGTLPLVVPIDLELLEDLDTLTRDRLELYALVVLPEALERSPQRTLARVARARREGRVVCVDGLTTTEQVATLLPLIEPDIIITGADLLAPEATRRSAEIANALAAHTERSHAVVIAEGVDTEERRRAAQSIGAMFGIGALYPSVESPAAFTTSTLVPMPALPVWTTPPAEAATPFAIASQSLTPRRARKRLLLEMSKTLEEQAAIGGAAIVLGTFQHARHFTAATASRWQAMSRRTGLAGVYAVDLLDIRDGNVHQAPIAADDALAGEWNVAILGPHFAALLSARDLHTGTADMERSFDFVQTYDRVTVTQAVHSILKRFG